jgi:adenosylcobinamide-GDP ribazoletransferase
VSYYGISCSKEMTMSDSRFAEKAAWLSDLRLAAVFLTRVPGIKLEDDAVRPLGEAFRAFPLIGAAIGLVGGLVYALANFIGMPSLAAALLAVGLSILLTGGLHEDGLADMADGIGGADREKRLAIMKDSRIGSFGVLALIIGVGLKVSALAELGALAGCLALIATEGASRAVFAPLVGRGKPAKPEGLGAMIGKVESDTVSASILLGVLCVVIGLGPVGGLIAAGLVALAMKGFYRFAEERLGGYTGDVLGAAQQISAIIILLTASVFR